MKLIIMNETKYSTRNLRTFFLAGMKAMGIKESKRVRVAYSHASKHWGQAQMGQFTNKLTGGVRRYEGWFELGVAPNDRTSFMCRVCSVSVSVARPGAVARFKEACLEHRKYPTESFPTNEELQRKPGLFHCSKRKEM